MRIGILTGGGDVPGLNACIKAFVNRAEDEQHEVVGIRRGWAGLLYWQAGDLASEAGFIVPLDKQYVRTVDRTGGTFLHSSRTNPAKVGPQAVPEFLSPGPSGDGTVDLTQHVLKLIEHLGLEALVPIGGDDTLSFALRLHDEGVPIVAIPKTMDNDVHGTDYCIGFSTAVTRSVQFIQDLRTSAGSHERIAVVELFGRYSGETSLVAAYLSGVDRAIISEIPFDPNKLAGMLIADKRSNPSNYAMMTISEGAKIEGGDLLVREREDAFGHRKLGGIGAVTGDLLREITGEHIIYQQLAYLMRSGRPDSLDLMVATNFAVMAADLASAGQTGRMVALRQGIYTNVPLTMTREGVKRVDVDALYDVESYRPKVRQVAGTPMFLY
ncbi:MAG TPA: 6-phosphofructokinase [Anaerolineales bacterium]